jgi:hypothetical protein
MNFCPICGVAFRDWHLHSCYSRQLSGIEAANTRATRDEGDPSRPPLFGGVVSVGQRIEDGFAMLSDDD